MDNKLAWSLALVVLLQPVPAAAQSSGLNVAIVFDTAGKYDHAMNQAANDGAERAASEFGVNVSTATPVDTADATSLLGSNARNNALIISIGQASTSAINTLAKTMPTVHFAVVDDLPVGQNTMGIRFRENEGAFMAGYIAASDTSTNVIGIVAPATSPVTARFISAYRAGVKLICGSCTVLAESTTGVTPAEITASAERISKTMMLRGADILFVGATKGKFGVVAAVRSQQCLKASSLPVGVKFTRDLFANIPRPKDYQANCAGNTRPVFFIGWESDYVSLGDTDADPTTLNSGLTCIVKRADNAVYALIRDQVKRRPWRTGETAFGFQNNGLEVTVNPYNTALFGKDMLDRMKKVEGLIANGVLKLGD
jgi:basic membrane protein A